MTAIQFCNVKMGDHLINSRSPGIILRVTNRYIGPDGLQIEVETSAGRHWISYLRHKEYQQAYPQTKLELG